MTYRFISQKPNTALPELFAAFRAQHPEGVTGKSWYSIKNIGRDEAEVFIYDEIGGWGISASEFMNDFSAIKAKSINLRINSPGGDVFDGVAIYNAIRRQDATVNVYVDGLAASAASFIAMAGDTVTMSPKSQMMIHDAWGLVVGPADDMRKMADMLDKTSDNIASIYADRAGGTVAEWRARMREETWLSDAEAVAVGLADGIDGMDVEDLVKAQADPEPKLEPEEEPAPEGEPEPVAINFKELFNDHVEQEVDALFAA